MLIDSTGTMKVDGWSNAMPRTYAHVEPGDVVVFTNLAPGAWVNELRATSANPLSFGSWPERTTIQPPEAMRVTSRVTSSLNAVDIGRTCAS